MLKQKVAVKSPKKRKENKTSFSLAQKAIHQGAEDLKSESTKGKQKG